MNYRKVFRFFNENGIYLTEDQTADLINKLNNNSNNQNNSNTDGGLDALAGKVAEKLTKDSTGNNSNKKSFEDLKYNIPKGSVDGLPKNTQYTVDTVHMDAANSGPEKMWKRNSRGDNSNSPDPRYNNPNIHYTGTDNNPNSVINSINDKIKNDSSASSKKEDGYQDINTIAKNTITGNSIDSNNNQNNNNNSSNNQNNNSGPLSTVFSKLADTTKNVRAGLNHMAAGARPNEQIWDRNSNQNNGSSNNSNNQKVVNNIVNNSSKIMDIVKQNDKSFKEGGMTYTEALEFFAENGIQLDRDQLYALQELSDMDAAAKFHTQMLRGAVGVGKKLVGNAVKAHQMNNINQQAGVQQSPLKKAFNVMSPLGNAMAAHKYNQLQKQSQQNAMVNTLQQNNNGM